MAATSWNPKNPRIQGKDGIPPITSGFAEAASQSYKAGTPVYESSGLKICADGTAGFTGIAMQDASGTTSTAAAVQTFGPDDFILAYVTNNGTAALANTLTPGTGYGWYVDSDSVFYADANDTSNVVLIFVEEILDASNASTYWGKFKVKDGITGNLNV